MEDSSMDKNHARTGRFYIPLKGCCHGIWTQLIGMKMAYLSIESYSRGDGYTHRILKFGLSPSFGYWVWCTCIMTTPNAPLQSLYSFFLIKYSQSYCTSHNKWLSSCIVLLVLFTTKVSNSNMCISHIYNIYNYKFTSIFCIVTKLYQGVCIWTALKSRCKGNFPRPKV
jgi:hypothetical protein